MVIDALAPIRERYRGLMEDPDELDHLLATGAARAASQANRRLDDMKRKVGFLAGGRR